MLISVQVEKPPCLNQSEKNKCANGSERQRAELIEGESVFFSNMADEYVIRKMSEWFPGDRRYAYLTAKILTTEQSPDGPLVNI